MQADLLAQRQDAAGGPAELAALERALEINLLPNGAQQFGDQFASVFEDLGTGQEAVDFIRSVLSLGEPRESSEGFFPLGDPAEAFDADAIREQLGLPPVSEVPVEAVSQNASEETKVLAARARCEVREVLSRDRGGGGRHRGRPVSGGWDRKWKDGRGGGRCGPGC